MKNGSSSYTHDANGNMTTDGNRAATLTYNYLNLPKTVKTGANTMTYDYDASGVKHKYVGDTLILKYAGAFEYQLIGNVNQLYRVVRAMVRRFSQMENVNLLTVSKTI